MGALPLTSFTPDVRGLTPDALGDALASAGIPLLVLDVTRLNRDCPRLRPVYDGSAEGWTRVARVTGLRAAVRDGVVARPRDPVAAAFAVPGAPPPRWARAASASALREAGGRCGGREPPAPEV